MATKLHGLLNITWSSETMRGNLRKSVVCLFIEKGPTLLRKFDDPSFQEH